MTTPAIGVGSLIANDILTDASFSLFEPCVNAVVPGGGIAAGTHTVLVWDASLYVGAEVLVGVLGGDLEVVTVTAVNPGVSFTATFTNPHVAGEPIVGATFPIQSVAGDPFWTQTQMLQYLSNALNDFVLEVPLCYTVNDSISVAPTQQFAALPADCMFPVRISAFGVGLRETSQSNLDGYDYRWQQQSNTEPYTYYRDKIGLQKFGIWPRANNVVPVEIVYANRGQQLMGLADGFPLPDPFTPYLRARVLEFCYSGDSEQRSPAMAGFWNQRYEAGVKIAKVILDVINDTAMQ